MTKLSRQAETDLLAASGRAGAKVPTSSSTAHLQQIGLVSPAGNLTAKGEMARTRISRQREDEAFG